MKRTTIRILTLCTLCIALFMQCFTLSNAATPRISNKKITLKIGKSKKITIKNSKKKVKWSVKGESSSVKLSDKKKNSVIVKAIKAGKATVIGKIGKKSYFCTVTVIDDSKFSNLNPTEKSSLEKWILEQNNKGAQLPTDILSGYNKENDWWDGDVRYVWNDDGHLECIDLYNEYALLNGNISFEGFPYLKSIHIEHLMSEKGSITGIDVSSNSKLESLVIYDNKISSIDTTNNLHLKQLYVSGNELLSIDISKNSLLEELECDNNMLTMIDLSNNPSLYHLSCLENSITYLDCTKTNMTDLLCDDSVTVIGLR